MSGRGSRQRRKEAVKSAHAVVYENGGAAYSEASNPYTQDRQRRIFADSYRHWRERYWRMESLADDLAEAYGEYRYTLTDAGKAHLEGLK